MIGQELVKSQVNAWDLLPKFIIVEGETGSGRKTLIRFIASKFSADSIVVGSSVEDVRNIIEDSRSIFKPRIYVIDGNSLSMSALNSLLKIAEEPPSNCHLAMIVDSINNALPTLASRARVLTMLPYSTNDKLDFLKQLKGFNSSEIDSRVLVDYCHLASNLAMLENIVNIGPEEVFEEVTTFYDLIWDASESNSLKVTNWLKFKESDTDKLDPALFFQCLINWCSVVIQRNGKEMTFEDVQDLDKLVRNASKCLRRIKRKGSNARVAVNDFIRKVKQVE